MKRGRRKRFRSYLKRNSRFLAIWAILLILAIISQVNIFISEHSSEEIASVILILKIACTLVVCGIILLVAIHVLKERHYRKNPNKTFKEQPWLFDRKSLTICGEIERVFRTDIWRKVRQYLTHLYRKLILDHDPSFRYDHQRFLMSSPQLKPGERIMISHNTSFGKIALKEGAWVKVCGEYIHRRGRTRGFWGASLTFYGLVHKTHEPLGYVRILEDKPNQSELADITFVE